MSDILLPLFQGSRKERLPDLPSLPAQPALTDPVAASHKRHTQRGDSGLFRLPWELRRQILVHAFGDKTVHVDLSFRVHLHDMETSGGGGPMHGGYPPLAYSWSSELRPRGPRAWRWYNCVCHHVSPEAPYSVALRFDDCLFGTAQNCDHWEGIRPQKCKLGITGFLMTCQQGYEEATDVLYSTCRLFIKGQPLVDGLLQQYILPDAPRLTGPNFSRVKSLVLSWSLVLFGNDDVGGPNQGGQHLRFLRNLELLPRAFPHLTRLYLAFFENLGFSGGQYAPLGDDPLSEVTTDFLDPIRRVGERIEGLAGLNFSAFIPHEIYTIILTGPLPDGAWSEDSYSAPGRPICIWYPLVSGSVRLADFCEEDFSFGRPAQV